MKELDKVVECLWMCPWKPRPRSSIPQCSRLQCSGTMKKTDKGGNGVMEENYIDMLGHQEGSQIEVTDPGWVTNSTHVVHGKKGCNSKRTTAKICTSACTWSTFFLGQGQITEHGIKAPMYKL